MLVGSFKNKTKLTNYIKYNLNFSHDVDDKIYDGEFFDLLNDLIRGHYNYNKLIGNGIDYYFITACDIYKKNRKLNIKHKDGSVCDFSFYKCVCGKKYSDEHYLKRGFRKIISDQTKQFKIDYFRQNADSRGYCMCEETGLKFTIKTAHIDHVYPCTFDSLFYEYFRQRKLNFEDVRYTNSGSDNRPEITDSKIAINFSSWHKKNAKLRCVYWRANLQGKRTNNFNNKQK